MRRRRDLRGCRVFSIDPITARDLDDAISIERVASGGDDDDNLFRVGVHIAVRHSPARHSPARHSLVLSTRSLTRSLPRSLQDVSYFVRPDTPLDAEAANR